MTLIKSAAYGDIIKGAWLCDKCLNSLSQRIEYSVYDYSPVGKCHECGKTARRVR